MNVIAGSGERLRSWKEIAAFFGADERTVRRWEGRGLPVRRIPGGARATVYAEVAELESWMRGRGEEGPEEAPGIPPAKAAPRRVRLAAAVLLILLAMGGSGFAWSRWSPAAAGHRPPAPAVDLYLRATFDTERRTPQSLGRARDLFGRAIAEDPAYAAAYSGLAGTYLLMREFSDMPDGEAYPRAQAAAERSLALDPGLADAHAAFGFVQFYWVRDWPRALASFERAIALDPRSARARHWYATALHHAGRPREAVAAIEEAERLDPSSRSILADKGLLLWAAGRGAEGTAILAEMAANDGNFYSPHAYLAIIHLASGRHKAFLGEWTAAVRLKGNPDQLALVEAARRGFQAGGARAMFEAMLSEQLRQRRAGRGSTFAIADSYARLGRWEAALAALDGSVREGGSAAVAIRVDEAFRPLYRDPRFKRLSANVARPGPAG